MRDTLNWYDTIPQENKERISKRVGVPPEKEQAVLAAWRAVQK